MNKSFCDTVITIPQTAGTCWFNALLMMIFYSQNSRKLLLQYNNFSDKNDELSIIFKSMLYKNTKRSALLARQCKLADAAAARPCRCAAQRETAKNDLNI